METQVLLGRPDQTVVWVYQGLRVNPDKRDRLVHRAGRD